MRIGVDARNLVPKLSGIGRYVIEMCRELGSQGHSVILYLPEEPDSTLVPIPGCEFRIANYKGPWRRVVWSLTALPHAANRDNLDLFWGPAHRLPPRLNSHLPKVLTIHDLVWRKAKDTMHWQTWLGERAFMRASLRRADVVVADSKATRADIADFEPEVAARTCVIYPGLTALPAPGGRNFFADNEDARYALFVGTLEPRKNLLRLLEAFASVPAKANQNLKLVIAGGQGWRLGDLSKLIEDHDLQSRVILTGYVSDAELARLYSSALFLVMPSLYEGFGLPIVEAQSFGVPAITSDRSSMPEVGKDAALYVDPYNIPELAKAILELSTNTELRGDLARRCKPNSEWFSWEEAASMLLSTTERVSSERATIS